MSWKSKIQGWFSKYKQGNYSNEFYLDMLVTDCILDAYYMMMTVVVSSN